MSVKVRKRGGKWWVFVHHQGRRRAKCIGTQRAAQVVAERLTAQLVLGESRLWESSAERSARDDAERRQQAAASAVAQQLRFPEYFAQWVRTHVAVDLKTSTAKGYDSAYRRYLRPQFGDRDIRTIRRDEVRALAAAMLTAGKSRSYVKGVLAPLSAMFSAAMDDQHVRFNPAVRALGRARGSETRGSAASPLSREQIGKLLDATRREMGQWYPFVLCLARTGMRIGEAIGLQWDDLDLRARQARVCRAIVDGHVTTPKSGKSRRVDLSKQLTETLQAQRTHRKRECLQRGWPELPPWVFVTRDGSPIDPDHFRSRVWSRLFELAGIPRVRIHDLRHTFASLLIAQGESLLYVKEQMGHHSIRVTVDIYGHLLPGGNTAAVDRLDDATDATNRNPGATKRHDDAGG